MWNCFKRLIIAACPCPKLEFDIDESMGRIEASYKLVFLMQAEKIASESDSWNVYSAYGTKHGFTQDGAIEEMNREFAIWWRGFLTGEYESSIPLPR